VSCPRAAAPHEPHQGRQARLHPKHVEAVTLRGSRRRGASTPGARRAPGPLRAPSLGAATMRTLAGGHRSGHPRPGRCSPTGGRLEHLVNMLLHRLLVGHLAVSLGSCAVPVWSGSDGRPRWRRMGSDRSEENWLGSEERVREAER
jgi:hypothetical protein